ncbi:MAG: UDP-N-acetylglucosamine 2-epimerase [Lachnospiraceae bacterium]
MLVMPGHHRAPGGVAAGHYWAVGTDEQQIYAAVRELLTDPAAYHQMEHAVNPYGDGKASQYICDILAGGDPLHPRTARHGRAGAYGETCGLAVKLPPLGDRPRGSPVWCGSLPGGRFRPPFGDRPHGSQQRPAWI